jgi:hypothetical protein
MRYDVVLMMVLGIGLAACGKSGATATGTAPSAGEKLKEDLTAVGHDIKDAATQAAADAKPAAEAAKDNGQALIHEGAQKVADWTATQPVTGPATQR